MGDRDVDQADPNPSTGNVEEVFAKLQKMSKVVHGTVKENIKKAQSRQKMNYDRQHVSKVSWVKCVIKENVNYVLIALLPNVCFGY